MNTLSSSSSSLETKNYVIPTIPVNTQSYEKLKIAIPKRNFKLLKDHFYLHVKENDSTSVEELYKVVGEGGSKTAYLICKNRVLLLPNMDVKSPSYIAEHWERMVLEEVKISAMLNSIGLLTPSLRQVQVSFTETSEEFIPAYTAELFENLISTKNCFILDLKDWQTSTWITHHDNHLFKTREDRLNEKNWDTALDSLLKDLAKLCFYEIPLPYDCLNLAFIKQPINLAETASEYKVRYFGFDFTSYHYQRSIPTTDTKTDPSEYESSVRRVVRHLLDYLFYYEFGNPYDSGEDKEAIILEKRLVENYIKKVLSLMESFSE